MINSFVEIFFGCSHKRTTFPITPGRSVARSGTYVACLDCGKEFSYDWKTMQVGEQVASRPNGQPVALGRPA
jgi:hypothetical protein